MKEKDEKQIRFNLLIDEYDYELLRSLAFDKRKSMAELVRKALSDYLKGITVE